VRPKSQIQFPLTPRLQTPLQQPSPRQAPKNPQFSTSFTVNIASSKRSVAQQFKDTL